LKDRIIQTANKEYLPKLNEEEWKADIARDYSEDLQEFQLEQKT
jgi:hypothetical protein